MGNQSHRIISGLTVFLMVVVVAAGWFLVAQPQVAAAQAGATQLVAAQQQITDSQAKITALRAAKGKLPDLEAKLASLQASIPDGLDAAPFIRELAALAEQQGVHVDQVQVSDAVLYAPAAAADGAAPGATAASGSATPAPSATPTPAATAAAPSTPTAWSAPTDPAITAANFATIPLAVTFSGSSWSQIESFLTSLQTGPRLYLVNKVDVQASADGSGAVANTHGLLYATIDPSAQKSMTGYTTTKPQPTPSASTTPRKSTPSPTSTADPSSSPSATPSESATPHE
jgi:Tfp pilus assembly protein PilO